MAADPVYAVELAKDLNAAQFNAGGEEIELSSENPRFETTDRQVYIGIRDLAFLVDLGEVKAKKGGAE
jgi:hypothetical protein